MVQLSHQQKNITPTKQIESAIPLVESLKVSPSQEPCNPCTDTMYASMVSKSDLRKNYYDQIGQLPLQYSRGHNYMFILYD